jgi:hypothetical protein
MELIDDPAADLYDILMAQTFLVDELTYRFLHLRHLYLYVAAADLHCSGFRPASASFCLGIPLIIVPLKICLHFFFHSRLQHHPRPYLRQFLQDGISITSCMPSSMTFLAFFDKLFFTGIILLSP